MRRYVDITINKYPEHQPDNYFIFKDLARVIKPEIPSVYRRHIIDNWTPSPPPAPSSVILTHLVDRVWIQFKCRPGYGCKTNWVYIDESMIVLQVNNFFQNSHLRAHVIGCEDASEMTYCVGWGVKTPLKLQLWS